MNKILPKIDIHAHTNPDTLLYHEWGRQSTPDELRAIYDQYGIEKSLLLPSIEEISMREARDIAKKYSYVFGWWNCNFDPMLGYNDPERDLTDTLTCYKEAGARGIGELTVNYYFDDPCMLNLFKYAEQLDMPVTFHIGNKGHDYGVVDELGLPRLEKVLQMFPKLRFLGHSQKFWAEIGQTDPESRKGYPKGPVVPGRVVELMRKYPNLCGDLSAGSGCNAIMRDPEFGYGFLEEFQDRLYYGTDICDPRNITNPMLKLSAFLDDAMQRGKISYAAYEKISRGNALELLER